MSKRKSRRVEQVMESSAVRRSPRLSQRYTSMLGTGERLFPLTYAATSRQSLSTYSRLRDTDEYSVNSAVSSILDESGQSVPASFDRDVEHTTTITASSARPYTTATAAARTDEDSEPAVSCQPGEGEGYGASGLQYDTPPQYLGDRPQHLYGLDGSDDDSTYDDAALDKSCPVTVERVITRTPPRGGVAMGHVPTGVLGRLVSFLLGLLYKAGSLLYLTATAILCLDVLILSWCFAIFQAATGGTVARPSKLWHRFWILLLTVVGLLAMMLENSNTYVYVANNSSILQYCHGMSIKGVILFYRTQQSFVYHSTDLVMDGASFPVPTRGTVAVNMSEAELAGLQAKVEHSVSGRLREELLAFKASFHHEVEDEIERHIQKALAAGESGLKLEKTAREAAIKEIRAAVMKELDLTVEERLVVLQSALDAQLSALHDTVLAQAKTSVSQSEHKVLAETEHSTAQLKKELKLLLDQREQVLANKVSRGDSAGEDALATIDMKLDALESQLRATSSELHAFRIVYDEEMGSLRQKQTDLLASFARFKQTFMDNMHDMETTSGKIDASMAAALFHRELEQALADDTSALKQFISLSSNNITKLQEQISNVVEVIDSGKIGSEEGIAAGEVEQLIQAALSKYSADRIAKFDFALENAGGSVIADKSSPTYSLALADVRLFGLKLWTVSTSRPSNIIQPSVYPGDCWAFEGSSGHVLIKLRDEVVITGATVEHVPSSLTPNASLSSAPEKFAIWGKASADEEGDFLGQYAYKLDGPTIQEFSILDGKVAKAHGFVLVEFLSNHGNEHFTCVYRVRIHGRYLD